MVERSVNAPARTVESSPETLPPVQQVYREPIELYRLEEKLAIAKSAEEQYNILSLIIARELAQALNIEPPANTLGTKYREWRRDMEQLRDIAERFKNRTLPVPQFPHVAPMMGKEIPQYDITLDGDNPVSTVLGDHLPGYMDVLMRYRLQAVYHRATQPLSAWHLEIRTLLAKYKVWDMDSEVLANLSSYTDSDQEKDLDSAKRYTEAMRQRNAGTVETPDVETVDDDDYSDDDLESPE